MAKLNKTKKEKDNSKFRHRFQFLWAFLTNANLTGYASGNIYQGKFKTTCVPGLNCYSCVGALGSCPIGAMQAVIGKRGHYFSYYVFGFLMLIGTLIGRAVCGWLCPFGLLQDLLNKIPFMKKIRTVPYEKHLIKLKYVIFLVFVILMPMYLVNIIGNGDPYFCKYVCPVGILEGGWFLFAVNKSIRAAVGFLFVWKNIILLVTVILSIMIYRPFCKFVCPLGAVYSLFNKVSIYRYYVDMNKCISCGKCADICMMNCNPVRDANAFECIRCGACKAVCPTKAIHSSSHFKIVSY